jgi:hypothetical protein
VRNRSGSLRLVGIAAVLRHGELLKNRSPVELEMADDLGGKKISPSKQVKVTS